MTDDKQEVTLRIGDAAWHDGPGWYYTIDEYEDEGSCGAFPTREAAIDHAMACGYVVARVIPFTVAGSPPSPAGELTIEVDGVGATIQVADGEPQSSVAARVLAAINTAKSEGA